MYLRKRWSCECKHCRCLARTVGSFENEAGAQSIQDSKTEHPNLENEAPKSRNHCRLKNYNIKSCMTQAEPGGGNAFVRTSKSPQIYSKILF